MRARCARTSPASPSSDHDAMTETPKKIREKDLGAQQLGSSAEYFKKLGPRFQLGLLIAFLTPLAAMAIYFNVQLNATMKHSVKLHLRALAEASE